MLTSRSTSPRPNESSCPFGTPGPMKRESSGGPGCSQPGSGRDGRSDRGPPRTSRVSPPRLLATGATPWSSRVLFSEQPNSRARTDSAPRQTNCHAALRHPTLGKEILRGGPGGEQPRPGGDGRPGRGPPRTSRVSAPRLLATGAPRGSSRADFQRNPIPVPGRTGRVPRVVLNSCRNSFGIHDFRRQGPRRPAFPERSETPRPNELGPRARTNSGVRRTNPILAPERTRVRAKRTQFPRPNELGGSPNGAKSRARTSSNHRSGRLISDHRGTIGILPGGPVNWSVLATRADEAGMIGCILACYDS